MNVSPGALAKGLKGFSLFAIATGTIDLCLGLDAISTPSGLDPNTLSATALLDSQLRFLGSVWAGYGLTLWWVSNDIKGRRVPLALLGATLVLGGVARSISALKYGFSATFIKVATAVEFVGPLAVYLLGG